jgi:hypothetical protein
MGHRGEVVVAAAAVDAVAAKRMGQLPDETPDRSAVMEN